MDDDTPMATDLETPDLETPSTPISTTFIPPSINRPALLAGDSYTYFSPVPPSLLVPITTDTTTDTTTSPGAATSTLPPCALGIDEAGRGPVLGPMIYGTFYLPLPLSTPLLRTTHHFDDSKVLTPSFRASLLATLCTPSTALHASCGWAIASLSARDISSGMLRPSAYNLNAQAFDATVSLIRGVLDRGVNVTEVYVDTVGQPEAYQRRLEREFPALRVTVAKKADSLYPCVSAASVCAKVTRDVALEVLWEQRGGEPGEPGWGSGYPSDGRCSGWLRGNMHPVFGWRGAECRASWGTAKDMLEAKKGKGGGVGVEWPVEEGEEGSHRVTDFFSAAMEDEEEGWDELGTWFGRPAGVEAF
ncbi:ribonuclease HII [Podospora conica]|nr:ribonuclease HII [Schizothecium conicum]